MSQPIKYESPVATITWDNNNGVFIFKMKASKANYDEAEVKKQFDFFKKHSKNKPYKVIVDTRNSPNLPTDNAFNYFFSNNNPKGKNAILAKELAFQVLMGQMYKIKAIKNHKLFKCEEEAMKWLLED